MVAAPTLAGGFDAETISDGETIEFPVWATVPVPLVCEEPVVTKPKAKTPLPKFTPALEGSDALASIPSLFEVAFLQFDSTI